MKPHMSIQEAYKVVRPPIAIGAVHMFYSDCVGCETESGEYIRSYSGQAVRVIERVADHDPDADDQYKVVASNGDTFQASKGELNGWIFDTGQWVGPRVN